MELVAVDAGEEQKTCPADTDADAREVVETGVKRSATWFATTIAQLCSRERDRRRAPSRTSCAERVASANGVFAELRSAR